jgi:hypothetical protein
MTSLFPTGIELFGQKRTTAAVTDWSTSDLTFRQASPVIFGVSLKGDR